MPYSLALTLLRSAQSFLRGWAGNVDVSLLDGYKKENSKSVKLFKIVLLKRLMVRRKNRNCQKNIWYVETLPEETIIPTIQQDILIQEYKMETTTNR